MSMEDFFNVPEMPETSVLKTNADVVSHISEALANTDDLELSQLMFQMLNKHSQVVLETSQKIMSKYKMHLQSVK
tara:strand:+ start:6029 stop:6253 length:225 start_codon:yes stop_codon:yes gene_type:complete